MTISLDEAIALIQSASAAIFDEDVVTYAQIQDGDDCFMQVSWENDNGNRFAYDFYRDDNLVVEVVGNSLWLQPTYSEDIDDSLEPMQVTLLFPKVLEPSPVYLVFHYKPDAQMEFQGVFTSEARAIDACPTEQDCICPAVLDEALPADQSIPWPGAWYPRLEPKHPYTYLDAVAREGSHASFARQ